MARSFLNTVTVDGKLCRIAELGFHADLPSFRQSSIVFCKDKEGRQIDLDTGMLKGAALPSQEKTLTSPDGRYTVRTELASKLINGVGYVHLVLRDNENGTETVLTRFMGNESSIGAKPFADDSRTIVFFGYPEEELG